MSREELITSRCIGAELELVRMVFKEAGGNPNAVADMTVRDFVEACVKNGIVLQITAGGYNL